MNHGPQESNRFPARTPELFDRYVHGDIPRRDFLEGAKKFAVGGVTATAIWESLRPNYAWAEQVPKDDKRIKTELCERASPKGNGSIKGYFARPAKSGKLPGVLVVHENRGLNPYIEDVARRLAVADFMAFAPDGLTSVGGYPGDNEKGGELFQKVDRPKMTEDFIAAAQWLKARPDCTGKIGVVGFCFGGGIANNLAVRLGSDLSAAVPFYGGSHRPRSVSKIKAPLLLQYASLDTRINGGWPRVRGGVEGKPRHLHDAYVRRRQSRIPQRHHAPVRRSRGQTRVATHAGFLQQISEVTSSDVKHPHRPCISIATWQTS